MASIRGQQGISARLRCHEMFPHTTQACGATNYEPPLESCSGCGAQKAPPCPPLLIHPMPSPHVYLVSSQSHVLPDISTASFFALNSAYDLMTLNVLTFGTPGLNKGVCNTPKPSPSLRPWPPCTQGNAGRAPQRGMVPKQPTIPKRPLSGRRVAVKSSYRAQGVYVHPPPPPCVCAAIGGESALVAGCRCCSSGRLHHEGVRVRVTELVEPVLVL